MDTSQLLKGVLDAAVLAVVEDDDGYGYDVVRRLRHAGLACPTCGQPLRQVVGEAAAAHLTPGQQAEEKIESVAYDAWECPAGHALTLAYPTPGSTAQPCPACHFRTFTESQRQPGQAPTARAAGWGWEVTQCHFCQH